MLPYQEQNKSILTRSHLEKQQKEAAVKKEKRVAFMGELLRSKGFVWTATAHYVMGGWQQAGSVIRLEAEGPWMCVVPDMWKDTPNEPLVLKDMTDQNGEKFPFEDRRQELVFIGVNLSHQAIQSALDRCLLTNEEMDLKPEGWLDKWEEEDKIGLAMESEDEDEDEETDGNEDEEMDDEENDEKVQNGDKTEQNGIKGKKDKKESQKVDKDGSEPPLKKMKKTVDSKKKTKN